MSNATIKIAITLLLAATFPCAAFRAANESNPAPAVPAPQVGKPIDDVTLRSLAWGPAATNGLRAACYFEPTKDAYADGEVVKRWLVFHNHGKEPVFFTYGGDTQWNVIDDRGANVPLQQSFHYGLFRRVSFHLQPGHAAEVECMSAAIGASSKAEGRTDTAIQAKPDTICRARWNVVVECREQHKVPLNYELTVFREQKLTLETGEVRFRITEPSPKNAALASIDRSVPANGQMDVALIERRVQAVYRTASPAVVRLAREKDREEPLASGVIVSAEGHVLTVGKCQDTSPLVVILSDGRRVPGTALGWSLEWNLGLIKIAQKGPWPYARLREKADVRGGELCVLLGYLPKGGFALFERQPTLRLGHVPESVHPLWFPSSCTPGNFGEGLFDLDGRLIGMIAMVYPALDYAVCASVEVAKTHWEDLIAGKNLDRVRLFPTDEEDPAARATKPLTAQPKEDEKRVSAAIEKAMAATVRIVAKDNPQKVSGVIVTADGYVITCGHHFMLPGHKVTLLLADGRNAAGEIVGANLVSDVGLAKITDKGPWPHAELGRSTTMKAGDPCLALGYPADRQDRLPMVIRTEVVDPPDLPWSCRLYTSSSSRPTLGGMSGGGVFDLEGRVVATHSGTRAPGHISVRIEVYRKQWDQLTAGRPADISLTRPLAGIESAFRRVASGLPPFVVQVLRNGSPCALGTVVRGDGRILTKASEVYGAVSCRLADGRELPAAIEKETREHDLAVLKIEAMNLPAAEWSKGEGVFPGGLISALIPGQTPSVAVVSLPSRSIAPSEGWLGVGVEDSDRGLVVGDDSMARWFDVPLCKGDIILHLEGRQKPNLATLLEVLGTKPGNPEAGDLIRMGVSRQGESLEFRFPLVPSKFVLPADRSEYENRRDPDRGRVSLRSSGFPSVFDTMMPLTPIQCGGPLVDIGGRVAGIAIASVRGLSTFGDPRAQIHVIPAAEAKRFVSDQ